MKDRHGFTLLEVIVALVLMGSVLAGSLVAFSRHRQQLALAEKRIEAAMIADQLVGQLASPETGLPRGAGGPVLGKPGWSWQTSLVGTSVLAGVPVDLVRFEIFEASTMPTRLIALELTQAVELP